MEFTFRRLPLMFCNDVKVDGLDWPPAKNGIACLAYKMLGLRALPCRYIGRELFQSGFCTEVPNDEQKLTKDTPETPPVNKELEDLQAKNKQLLQERNEFEDKYKRALAEAENVRKRMHRQVEDAKFFGIQSFCKDLLEVADILGKATESAPEDQLKEGVNPHFQNLFEGLKMTDAQLLKVFGKYNLHKIAPAVGDAFNPNIHEAMFTVPVNGESKPNTIAVTQKVGYSLHNRTLRPAYVGVFTACVSQKDL